MTATVSANLITTQLIPRLPVLLQELALQAIGLPMGFVRRYVETASYFSINAMTAIPKVETDARVLAESR